MLYIISQNKKNIFIKCLIILFCSTIYANETTINNYGFKNGIKDEKPYKVISFGEKVDFGNIEDSATWTITNSKEGISMRLVGSQINSYVFEKPGFYEIFFNENKEYNDDVCLHAKFNEKMIIEVTPVRMVFDFSNIVFSKKISKGQKCDDIIITVPINIDMKEKSMIYKVSDITVAGIGVDLIAKPIDREIVIKKGTQLIKYQLSGVVSNETYLMFDFVDFNNQVQTYNQPEIVK